MRAAAQRRRHGSRAALTSALIVVVVRGGLHHCAWSSVALYDRLSRSCHSQAGASVPRGCSSSATAGTHDTDVAPGRRVQDLRMREKLVGTVTKIIRTGLFVDVGVGKDGFVHVSSLGRGRAEKPDDFWVGQELTTWVKRLKDKGFFELTCRPPVDLSGFRDVPEDEWLTGEVVGIDWGGLYVSLVPPGGGEAQQGKVRRMKIRKGRVKNTFKEAEVGQEVRVRVIRVDEQAARLDLSMRGLE
eukprot:CAMPEP_0171071552 /NCGR_PEP_ID=MMETSP0766_2-20121228/10386_1 /TAXON_ID=439317 /ORGANISM="Gambierdiscus australes, Strain CAWD 149" /LENGTH=242 /DNA_ID=CAMNT_0011528101 /DNA_START=18 /DNA_END=746 /DNA_ORIENTATION=+